MNTSISKMVAIALLASGFQVAKADDFVTTTPTVHIAVAGLESQAQLAEMLRAQGYSQIILADAAPTFAAPHPELNEERIAHPQTTPVREGWNGVAVKEGKTIEIYADF